MNGTEIPKINTDNEPGLDNNNQLPANPADITVPDSDHLDNANRKDGGSGVRPNYTRPFTRGE